MYATYSCMHTTSCQSIIGIEGMAVLIHQGRKLRVDIWKNKLCFQFEYKVDGNHATSLSTSICLDIFPTLSALIVGHYEAQRVKNNEQATPFCVQSMMEPRIQLSCKNHCIETQEGSIVYIFTWPCLLPDSHQSHFNLCRQKPTCTPGTVQLVLSQI